MVTWLDSQARIRGGLEAKEMSFLRWRKGQLSIDRREVDRTLWCSFQRAAVVQTNKCADTGTAQREVLGGRAFIFLKLNMFSNKQLNNFFN